MIQTLGGNYLVLDPNAMLRGQREVVWAGLWRAGTRDQLPAFLARLGELGTRVQAIPLGKHVVPITQSLDDVPFDMRHHRTLKYLSNTEGLATLCQTLTGKLNQFTVGATTRTAMPVPAPAPPPSDDDIPF